MDISLEVQQGIDVSLALASTGHAGLEPLDGVSEAAYQLALTAGVDDVVQSLFEEGEELCIPGVTPSPVLIPTVIQVPI